jgi:hypothetical protein
MVFDISQLDSLNLLVLQNIPQFLAKMTLRIKDIFNKRHLPNKNCKNPSLIENYINVLSNLKRTKFITQWNYR